MKITVTNLQKTYKQEILKKANFQLESGKVYCLLGRNGVGKTTLMKILSGMLHYNGGSIETNPRQKLDEVCYYVSEKPTFLDFLSGFDNLDFVQKLHNMNMTREKLKIFIEYSGIQSFSDELVVNYSHGMKHQLALTIAFLLQPKVLLLDEPLVSLDPINIDMMHKKLKEYVSKGNIVFISTHMIPISHKIGDEILVLKNGIVHQVENDFTERDLEAFVLNKI
ncbi:ATP-binding cassette domain-containing protein [Bacillus bingmayongensis]|uniref:ATP-binding cassette domain-containing protein n=1 Tax=Bacillus bingmayongensis TaxID=1150157 RepID=UPI00031EAA0D|nr:ABC transporter ATP-binding protein [Bacillus bingmayongensis]MBY0595097.1 ABC transporter ATP-binding protein [Bacillus bingmayongensis]